MEFAFLFLILLIFEDFKEKYRVQNACLQYLKKSLVMVN